MPPNASGSASQATSKNQEKENEKKRKKERKKERMDGEEYQVHLQAWRRATGTASDLQEARDTIEILQIQLRVLEAEHRSVVPLHLHRAKGGGGAQNSK